MNPSPDLFEKDIVNLMRRYPEKFTQDFKNWLPDNLNIWEAFVANTLEIINAGYNHYSARTIICVMRHHSALHEKDSEYKIANGWSPYLARLFDLAYPNHAGIFTLCETKKVKKERGE